MAKATFGAGCFWGVEAAFRLVKGVKDTAVGFMGGRVKNPSYWMVCTKLTGHAEVVQVEYDPKKVSYEKLLDVFWNVHNPTTKNRQGWNVGNEYRSVIFFHDEKQKKAALESINKVQKSLKSKIVTEIKKAPDFYKAEEYHQKYLEKNIIQRLFRL